MKIIPAIDIRGGRCVRLFQGQYSQETVYGDPVEQAKKWESMGADFIHLVDLDGAKEGYVVNKETISKICTSVSIPCELGGGIRTQDEAQAAFEIGVNRVILGTVACENTALVESFTGKFGSDRIVVGIDAKNGKVAVRGWLDTSQTDAFVLAGELYLRGINRIIYTDIATDGSLKGPNFSSVRKMCETIPQCKIIASGGISCKSDVQGLMDLHLENLDGVIVGKALYDNRVALPELLELAAK